MSQNPEMKTIAKISNPFCEKFGIPRQSGLANAVTSRIIFEPEYRVNDAIRGLEDFSHIWLIWQFSKAVRNDWSPTVRPPRLGGNKRMGVFATRSPFRPNSIGLSCVELLSIEYSKELGPVLVVAGADIMDGTPIFDIKPYIPYADCKPEASGGFTENAEEYLVDVIVDDELLKVVKEELREGMISVLQHDPRPSYQNDPERLYGMRFDGYNIRFRVEEKTLTVTEITVASTVG